MSDWPSLLKGGEEKVVRVEGESNIIRVIFALEDLELYNWWRVDRPSVC